MVGTVWGVDVISPVRWGDRQLIVKAVAEERVSAYSGIPDASVLEKYLRIGDAGREDFVRQIWVGDRARELQGRNKEGE